MSKKLIEGFACVFYPESCPISNIYDYIFPIYSCAISPLHCWDKNPDGSLKKPHYHLLFQGNLSAKDKRFISKFCLNNEHYETIYDISAYYHYLYHWDLHGNKWCDKKAAYWAIDIKTSERFDLNKINNQSPDYFLKMVTYISNYIEFSTFVDDMALLPDEEFKKYLFSNWQFISRYIQSNYFCIDNK